MTAMEKNNKTLNVPHLRFPEFSGEWEKYKLDEIATISKERIGVGMLSSSNYISTENMKSNFGGVDLTASLPVSGNVMKFQQGDTLLSNIRPYLKKIWQARFDGGCSADILVFRSNKLCNQDFLYYTLANEKFISYAMSGAKGVKMPRGDKEQILKYELHLPTATEQNKITSLLSLLDQRIETQKKVIEKYESLIRGISNKLLYEFEGASVRLGDILIERSERTQINNQHEVLSSTVKGIFSQREYFSKDIASENNVGYKIIRLHDVVLSPQNLWMGNINYNDKFDVGIVSPSYKIFSIADGYDKRFVAGLLKTHRALYNYMQVSEQGASIVRRNLNMEAFEQLVFKMPPLCKQQKIGNAISVLNLRLGIANRIKLDLELQKDWLLREMFI